LNEDGTVTAAEQAEYDATHPTEASSSDSSSSSSSDSTSGSDTSQLLADFLKFLQDSQDGWLGYSAGGSNVASQIQSKVINYLA